MHQKSFHRDGEFRDWTRHHFARETTSEQHNKIILLEGLSVLSNPTLLATNKWLRDMATPRTLKAREYLTNCIYNQNESTLASQLFEDKSVCSESDPVNSHIGNQTEPKVNAPWAK